MHSKSVLSAFLLILPLSLFAQQHHLCINDHVQIPRNIDAVSMSSGSELSATVSMKYVNTVVHVIYFNEADSIPSATIEAIITDLNALFGAEDIDTSYINPVHRDKLADSQIRFCLAETNPDGEPTTGITHTRTEVDGFPIQYSLSNINAEQVKKEIFGGVDPWDVDRYLNIWIAPVGINGENYSYGIPRAEYFPLNIYAPASAIPGAIIDVDNFQTPPPIGTLESLFAHECGHALGLLHTFDNTGTDGFDFCEGTDFIDDTPTASLTTLCDPSEFENTCTDTLNEQPDNVTNFMNYACQLMFTPGQVATMHNNLSLAPGGLFADAPCTVVSSIAESEIDNVFEFNIFPNPNNGNFSINLSGQLFSTGSISVYNSRGQKVFQRDITETSGTLLSSPLETAHLQSGIYYVSLHTEKTVYSQKMIVE